MHVHTACNNIEKRHVEVIVSWKMMSAIIDTAYKLPVSSAIKINYSKN